jgi:hyperosmotically inducible protein
VDRQKASTANDTLTFGITDAIQTRFALAHLRSVRGHPGEKLMNVSLKSTFSILVFASLLAGSLALAQDQGSSAPQPDNTKVNKRDNHPSQPTADQQKENRSDRDVTKQIRQSIVKDKSLSQYAHNVKVVAQNGAVTLKGPVRSDEEKTAIEQKAAEIVGKDKVTNELEVKPKQ